jgi:Mce-associated membrane protein
MTAADSPTMAGQSPQSARGPASPLAVAAVALAVIAVTVLAVVMQWHSSRNRQSNEGAASYLAGTSAQAAEAAAVREVTATLTYNYKTLAADFANAEKGLTPGFRTSYAQTTATSVEPLAKKYAAISTASVSASGVSSASQSGNAVTVLVFADQTVQNSQLAHPRLDRTRIQVSMVNLGGKWLIDHLTPL